jgi:hypothetical protein
MKSLRIIKLNCCQECPFRYWDWRIGGGYHYCEKTRQDLTEFLYPKDKNTIDAKRDFPEWCPLEVYFEH